MGGWRGLSSGGEDFYVLLWKDGTTTFDQVWYTDPQLLANTSKYRWHFCPIVKKYLVYKHWPPQGRTMLSSRPRRQKAMGVSRCKMEKETWELIHWSLSATRSDLFWPVSVHSAGLGVSEALMKYLLPLVSFHFLLQDIISKTCKWVFKNWFSRLLCLLFISLFKIFFDLFITSINYQLEAGGWMEITLLLLF